MSGAPIAVEVTVRQRHIGDERVFETFHRQLFLGIYRETCRTTVLLSVSDDRAKDKDIPEERQYYG